PNHLPHFISFPTRRSSDLDEIVEPNHIPLIARALLLDQAHAGRQLLGHRDHLVPRLRRRRDQILAVPEKLGVGVQRYRVDPALPDRKSTRLNSSHVAISYA